MNNILFISRAYGEHAGGMERLSLELIQTFTVKEPRTRKIVHEIQSGQSLFATRLSSALFALMVLPKAMLAAKEADVVHIGDPVLSFVGWCITTFAKKPVVVTVHGLDISYANPLYQLYLRLFFRSFSRYVAISEHAKSLMAMHNVSALVTVIPPGIYDRLYDASYTRKDLERLLKRDVGHATVLATTGRLIARKGHAWFIEHVFAKLPKNCVYCIAGSGPEHDRLAKLIRTPDLSDRVLLLGRISHSDQKIVLNTIDAFVQPNIHVVGDVEGFGLAPLEAALCGRSVFASRVDGIPSAIHHEKNGTLLPSEDASKWILALTAYMQHTEDRGEQARAYTRATFSWDVLAKKYEEVFTRATRQ